MHPRATLTYAAAITLILAILLAPVASADVPWPIPSELQANLSSLTEAQRAFIESGAALTLMPERQLTHEIATRDADGVQALVSALMAVADEMGYDATRDMGAAPLNTASKRFNRGSLVTPAPLRKDKRAAGPFSVHRYLFPQSGVPTFAGAKLAIWPEDLVAGKVDVAIIGVPSNASSGRRDAGAAPHAMRATNTMAAPDAQSLIKPHEALAIADYGDFNVDYLSTELAIDHVTDMVAQTAGTGAIPMLVGGDTAMLYPGVAGVARNRGNASFGLLQFNAHPDVDGNDDHTISDRRSMFRLLDEGVVRGSDTVQVGLRGPDVTKDALQWLRDKKVRYHTMVQIRQRGADKVLARVLREVAKGPDAFFVAVDVSVIDPAEMIAAGRVVTNGLRLEHVTRTVRHVCASKDIVGFAITDMAPMLDLSRLSVLNANAVLNACLVGIALRKQGRGPDYVHPLVLDHGQR